VLLGHPKRPSCLACLEIGEHGLSGNGRLTFGSLGPRALGQINVDPRAEPDHADALPGANSLASVAAAVTAAGAETTACRLYAVTYFLQVPPAGGTLQTPRLMRQVNGLAAVPVADGIINLQFSYDVINNTLGTISANQSNPIGAGLSPALIQKVNIWVLGESITQAGKKSQSMYLASSISTRNMSFCNSYSDQTTACQ